MTTFEPGASVVFTHGLRVRPLSTAFLATSAAPIMTDGFEVLVHEVMAAMTTDPWSTSVSVPSSRVTFVGELTRPTGPDTVAAWGAPWSLTPWYAGGSLAGKDSADASSTPSISSSSVWST